MVIERPGIGAVTEDVTSYGFMYMYCNWRHLVGNVHACLLLLFYAKAIVFQLYNGGDMIYGMEMRKPEPRPLPTQGAFTLPHRIGMV